MGAGLEAPRLFSVLRGVLVTDGLLDDSAATTRHIVVLVAGRTFAGVTLCLTVMTAIESLVARLRANGNAVFARCTRLLCDFVERRLAARAMRHDIRGKRAMVSLLLNGVTQFATLVATAVEEFLAPLLAAERPVKWLLSLSIPAFEESIA